MRERHKKSSAESMARSRARARAARLGIAIEPEIALRVSGKKPSFTKQQDDTNL